MSVQKVDIGALDREVFGTIGRPFIDAFNIDDGGGIDCDLKVFGDEGDTSFLWYDHSEDKAFLQRTTTDTSPGRLLYIQHLGSAMIAGQNIQGLQIRSRATGTGTIAGGCDGAEIKAGLNSDSDTGTIAGARAVIANIDAKKGTITTAHGVEMQVDIGSGGTITTLKGFRASLNNSGTLTDSYAFIVETANVSYPWEYGFYCAAGQATYPIAIVDTPTGTARNAVDIDIDDTYAYSSGYGRALGINVQHASGNITTAGSELNGIGIDVGATTGDVSAFFPLSIYTGGMGTGTIGNLWAVQIYMDDIGGSATVTNKHGVAIGIDNGDGATNCYMIRFYNHGGTINAALHFANNGATAFNHIIHFEGGVLPYVAATGVSTVAGVMQVKVGSTTLYCPLYSSKS